MGESFGRLVVHAKETFWFAMKGTNPSSVDPPRSVLADDASSIHALLVFPRFPNFTPTQLFLGRANFAAGGQLRSDASRSDWCGLAQT